MSTFHLSQMDAFAWLGLFPDKSVDLVVTDPPYESLEKHRSKGTTTRLKKSKASSNEWFPVIPNSALPTLMLELYRVLKPNTHCYLFSDSETMFELVPAAKAAGFKFWKPLVWDKLCMGMGYHYRARYEFVLFFEKGKRKLNDLGVADVLSHKRLKGPEYYPTQKPYEIAQTLIRQSTGAMELVIDPFMGSGSTGVACNLEHRDFAGNDILETFQSRPSTLLYPMVRRDRLFPMRFA